jgi:hypothetical protein
VTGPGRCDSLVQSRIPFSHGQRFLPVFPVSVLQQNGNGRTYGYSLAHSREDVGRIALNLHAPAAAISLLAAPELAVKRLLIDFQACGHARQERD